MPSKQNKPQTAKAAGAMANAPPTSKKCITASKNSQLYSSTTPTSRGYCYTQLTDIEQEQNGIYTYDRREKFDAKRLEKILRRSGGD